MSKDFDLHLNFDTNADAANKKIQELADSYDKVLAKVDQLGKATSQAMGQTVQSAKQSATQTTQAAQQAAQQTGQAATQAIHQLQQQYQQLLQNINQVVQAQRNVGRGPGGGAGAGGGGGNNPGGGGNQGGGGGGIPGFGGQVGLGARGAMAAMGLYGGAYAGFQMIRQLADDLKNLLPQAAANARQLQNLAEEFGTTAQSVYKLQTAAKLVGVDLGTMGMAARQLGEALEDPAGAGKNTAKAMTELGVSLRQSMGSALEDTIQKLSEIEDPAKRAVLSFELFKRSGAAINIVAENLRSSQEVMQKWGLGIDENVQKKLVAANTELEAFSTKITLLKAKAAEGIVLPVLMYAENSINTGQLVGSAAKTAGMGMLGSLMSMNPLAGLLSSGSKPNRPGGIFAPPGAPMMGLSQPLQFGSLNAALQNDSKISLAERVAKAKADYENELVLGKNLKQTIDPTRAGAQKQLDDEAKKVNTLREAYEKLQAQQKNPGAVRTENEYLAALQDRAILSSNPGIYRPLGELQMQESHRLRQISEDENLTAAQKKNYTAKFSSAYGQDAAEAQKKIQEQIEITTGRFNGEASKVLVQSFDRQAKLAHFDIAQGIKEYDDDAKLQKINIQSQLDQGSVGRLITSGNVKLQNTNARPGEEGQVASRNMTDQFSQLGGAFRDAMLLATDPALKDEEQLAAKRKAGLDLEKEGIEAIYQYEEKLADIRKQQLQETRSFSTGLFNALTSHQSSAGTNFFRGIGKNYADTIVGNIGEKTIGTLNSHLSLQRDGSQSGILGTAAKPNWLGQMLSGTPFGLDASKADPQTNALTKNSDETRANTDATKSLIIAVANLAGIDPGPLLASAGGRPSAADGAASSSGNSSTASGLPHAITTAIQPIVDGVKTITKGGGSPTSFITAAQQLAKGIGVPFASTNQSASRISIPSTGATDSISLSDLYPLPSAPPYGESTSSSGAPGVVDPSTLNIPYATNSTELGKLMNNVGYNPAKDQTASGDVSATSSFMKNFGTLLKGQGGPTGLQGAITGVDANGNPLSGWQQAGDALAVGGQVAGGGLAAYQGFSKGGARGDLQGIAGAAEAIAPFTGPAAPFIEAGGMIAGLAGALLPDPRQERIKNEQATATGDAFLQPASRDYNYSGADGGSGFSSGMNGSIRAGGPSANYNITLSALDAQSFQQWSANNPAAFSEAMLTALSSGSANSVIAQMQWVNQHSSLFS